MLYLLCHCSCSIQFQAIGGIGPKLLTTLVVWGAYPTWGRLIFPEEPLVEETHTAGKNVALNCSTPLHSIVATKAVTRLDCTLPIGLKDVNMTDINLAKQGKFVCDFIPKAERK